MSVASNLLAANTAGMETDTSGWTAGANTTLSWSTRFYAGAHSLGMTRTGSTGAASATTVSRVPVTAGSEYTAYAYFANVVAVSGRTATVRVDWWAAASGGTAISSVTTSAATLATATTWNTPPPTLIATAPAGAAFASVTVTVSGMAASETVAVDVISIGLPNSIALNALSYNAQGVEVDASGWQAVTNCAVGRNASLSFEGWYSLAVTSTAAGDTKARTATGYSVTPGTEYLGYAWVYAPVSGADYRTEIEWYDATNALLSTSTTPTPWHPPASTWTRCNVVGTAPTGAATARLVLRPTATASSQAWLFDQMTLRVSPHLDGSLLTYAEQDFEIDVSGWGAAGCTIAQGTANVVSGAYAMQVTATGGGNAVVWVDRMISIETGEAYQVAPRVYKTATVTDAEFDLVADWYDAAGVKIASSNTRWNAGTSAGTFTMTGGAVAPAGAVSMVAGIRFISPSAGAVFSVDMVYVGPGGLVTMPEEIPGQYAMKVTAKGLTTSGATTWGLWRVAADGSQTPIRGWDGDLSSEVVVGDVAVVEDYESPLGVPVRYRVSVWGPSLSLTYISPPVTLPEPDGSIVVLKDPGQPLRNCFAVVQAPPNWTRAARQGKNYVRGRARPIVITDVRSSREGSLAVVTETDEERTAVEWITDTGNTLLAQWPSGWGLNDMYVQVGDVTESRVSTYAGHSDRTWDLALTEVDRPIGGMTGSAARTWQDIADDYASWAEVFDAADSWLDVYTGIRGS